MGMGGSVCALWSIIVMLTCVFTVVVLVFAWLRCSKRKVPMIESRIDVVQAASSKLLSASQEYMEGSKGLFDTSP